mmetsp:Transcript_91109/g.229753  ORF Transcript_91109/g.229753 Transcript_91109/m.229753 type:complete len:202 (-) Transcript_91109:69-674(-)
MINPAADSSRSRRDVRPAAIAGPHFLHHQSALQVSPPPNFGQLQRVQVLAAGRPVLELHHFAQFPLQFPGFLLLKHRQHWRRRWLGNCRCRGCRRSGIAKGIDVLATEAGFSRRLLGLQSCPAYFPGLFPRLPGLLAGLPSVPAGLPLCLACRGPFTAFLRAPGLIMPKAAATTANGSKERLRTTGGHVSITATAAAASHG